MKRPKKKALPPSAIRYNEGKVAYHMIPPFALEQLGQVFMHGREKYSEDNWRSGKGLKLVEVYDSLMRHVQAWLAGEDKDKDSGLPHMAHAAWNALAIVELTNMNLDNDGRFKKETK